MSTECVVMNILKEGLMMYRQYEKLQYLTLLSIWDIYKEKTIFNYMVYSSWIRQFRQWQFVSDQLAYCQRWLFVQEPRN